MKTHAISRPGSFFIVPAVILSICLHSGCDKIPGFKQMYESNLEKGKEAFKNGDYEEAIQYLKKAVAINARSQEAHYFLGYAYDLSLLPEDNRHTSTNLDLQLKPLKHFKKVISIAPKYEGEKYFLDPYSKITSIWGNLAMVYLTKGKQDSAMWAFENGKKDGGFGEALMEYNRNTMASCEEDAILFTNGDMDTYPMWYLQIVEKYRTDINVINLSLLNASWYITLLKNNDPFSDNNIPVKMSDMEVDRLSPISWETRKIKVEIYDRYGNYVDDMIWTLKPTYSDKALRVQDLMVLRIIYDNRWKRPVYFSTTVSKENMIDLDEYLAMEGLVFRLEPKKDDPGAMETLNQNVLLKYSYVSIVRDETQNMTDVLNMAQNYRACFMSLIVHYYNSGDVQKAKDIFQLMEEQLPETKLPFTAEGVQETIRQYRERLFQL